MIQMTTNMPLQCDALTLPRHREGYRIIQIHPTLNCNLKCTHCYSSSGPGFKAKLNVEQLKFFLSSAYDSGYNTIAVSGGEPFLYPDLQELFTYTKGIGYYNSVTTNGALLVSKRNREIIQYLDLIAISIDGTKEEHNLIRNNIKAFDHAMAAVEVLKTHNTRFGFIHLLHNEPLETLEWLCQLVLTTGAKLLHLHPFENAGRGRMQHALALSSRQIHSFFILFHYLRQKYANLFRMQLDLIHKNTLENYPELAYCYKESNLEANHYMRELVIDEKGLILPVSHGFNPVYALGNINDKKPLEHLLSSYVKEKLPKLKNLYQSTYNEIINNAESYLFNLPELFVNRSFNLT